MLEPTEERDSVGPSGFWSEVAHRWFVQYNPLYLVSASLVLVGVFLVSGGLAGRDGLLSELWLTAITELYQGLLIAAAALLFRRGLRRPAVMLGLLEVVYLCDLTFQTGVAAYFGLFGWVFSLGWLSLSLLKLAALAWALRLRLSRSAMLVPALGAGGLALLPQLLHAGLLAPHAAARLLQLWIFGLVALVLWSRPQIDSAVELDPWAETVLRRAVRATWTIWLVLALGHAGWWSVDYHLQPVVGLCCGALLLATHFVRGQALGLIALAVAVAGLLDPSALSSTALMAATVLGLRAWRRRARPAAAPMAVAPHPYRDAAARPALPLTGLVAPPTAEARRSLTLALAALYVAVWTESWSGGALPPHSAWLALLLVLAMVPLAWRGGRAVPALVAAAVWGHLAVQQGILGAPSSTLQWGALLLGLGFALLFVGFLVSWFARGLPPPADRP